MLATVSAKRFLQIGEDFPQLRVYGTADACWFGPEPPTTRRERGYLLRFPSRSPVFPTLRGTTVKSAPGGEGRPWKVLSSFSGGRLVPPRQDGQASNDYHWSEAQKMHRFAITPRDVIQPSCSIHRKGEF